MNTPNIKYERWDERVHCLEVLISSLLFLFIYFSFVFCSFLMPRFHCSCIAKKSVRNFLNAPYHLPMNACKPISSYIHPLHVSMENCHFNKYHGNSDYNTPTKQVDVLICTLSCIGPYAELKKEYIDIIKNGRPN